MDDVAPSPAADDEASNKRRRVAPGAAAPAAAAAPAVESASGGGRAAMSRDPGASGFATNNDRSSSLGIATTIVDLPDTILSSVASYLPTPIPRALFAVAMTASEPSPNNDVRSMFGLGDDVEELDFSQAGRYLFSLTDHDLASILRLVDAVNKLKCLRLFGCVNITGAGLEPLRCSLVLEEIDLICAGCDLPDGAEPAISEAAVMPILRSIVDQNYSSLKNIIFPFGWPRNAKGSTLNAFLDDHDVCYGCGKIYSQEDSQEDDESFVGCSFEGCKMKDCHECFEGGADTTWCCDCDRLCDEHRATVWRDEEHPGCVECFEALGCSMDEIRDGRVEEIMDAVGALRKIYREKMDGMRREIEYLRKENAKLRGQK